MNENILFDLLKKQHIEYQLFRHHPVFTTEDRLICIDEEGAELKEITIPGIKFKNLFLKDKKNNTFYLIATTEDKRVDLKALSSILNCSRFSFGNAEELFELLKIKPGSVTPFGLMFDEHKKVIFILDEDFLIHPSINFHPLRNDMTVGMSPRDFLTCMDKIEHQPMVIRIPIQIVE